MSKKISRYEIEAEIGRGGMATVYRAHDPRFRRSVAIKVLPNELLHNPTFRARFEREAQTVAALEHPAIVPVHDFGEQDGQPFLVMRFMTGGSLADRLANGAMPVSEAARILNRLAPALDSAHSLGIIHRDLKPGNILFDQWNEPYLSDFGIVKLAEGQEATLTATGGVVGTPAYMSPEQVMGGSELDGRSDIYALGVILYEMLTGQRPYEADTPMALAFKHVNAPLPRIVDSNPKFSPKYQAVIEKAMAKDRSQRYGTAAALAAAVVKLAQEESTLETPTPVEPPAAVADDEETRIEKPPEMVVTETDEAIEDAVSDRLAIESDWQETAIEPPASPLPAPHAAPPSQSLSRPVTHSLPSDRLARSRFSGGRLMALLMGAAGLLVLLVICAAALIFAPRLFDSIGGQADSQAVAPPVYESGIVSEFIDEKWNEGFAITSLTFGNSAWSVVMSERADDPQQSLQLQDTLPTDYIDTKWSEGFEITGLAFGDNQWVVVMSRGLEPQRQTLKAETAFPSQYIDQKWAEGLDLAHMAYGNGQWTVVMSESANDFRQSLLRDANFPSDYINQKWAEDFEITGLAYGEGQWVVVMTAGNGGLHQSLWRDSEFPRQEIEERWAAGFEITTLAYGDGQWVVVMSQGVEPLRQTLRIGGW